MAATYGRVDFLYMNAGAAGAHSRLRMDGSVCRPALLAGSMPGGACCSSLTGPSPGATRGAHAARRSVRACAGRQYIGDMPNSDLRQMMMTVNTNFWGARVRGLMECAAAVAALCITCVPSRPVVVITALCITVSWKGCAVCSAQASALRMHMLRACE
jgi:hypothetical protein